MLENIGDRCFDKCITSPGSALSNSEQKCLAFCMDRYQDAMGVVTQSVVKRSQGM